MQKWLVLVMGLLIGPAGIASTGGSAGAPSLPSTREAPAPTAVEAPLVSSSRPFKKGVVDVVDDKLAERSAEQKAAEERLKAIEAAESQKVARVVILKYPQTDVDYRNEVVQRNVKTRIARPDAKFVPEIDLYQAGRREPDNALRPGDQRAVVPDAAIDRVLQAVDDVATIPWNALSDQDWGLKAHELRELAKDIWFVDRVPLREPLFLLYSQIGRAAESSNNPSPPFFLEIGGRAVNYYWYLAGVLANEEPALMSKLTEQDMYASISYYKDALDSGQYPTVQVSFEIEGRWDAKSFAGEYQVFINGLERTITSRDGSYAIKPGRTDIYLSRVDGGHSLSESVTLERLDGRIYFVRDVAQRLMGKEFIDQLMLHPYECSPELDSVILTYLAIYAKLHPTADIYIGLAKGGSVASRNIFLWRWDRVSSTLQKVLDDTGGFPVRFVGLMGSGIILGGASYDADGALKQAGNSIATAPPDNPEAGLAGAKDALNAMPQFDIAGLPISYQLRGHYGRLMVSTGIDFARNLKGQWTDMYQTDSRRPDRGGGPFEQITQVPVELDPATTNCQDDPLGCDRLVDVPNPYLRQRDWQRLVYMGVGVVLGRNAAIGFGPRGWIRTGWYNAPHAVDLTGHIGNAMMPPFFKHGTGRVRPILDLDFYGGVLIPFQDSLFIKENRKIGRPIPTAGTTVSVGLTF